VLKKLNIEKKDYLLLKKDYLLLKSFSFQ